MSRYLLGIGEKPQTKLFFIRLFTDSGTPILPAHVHCNTNTVHCVVLPTATLSLSLLSMRWAMAMAKRRALDQWRSVRKTWSKEEAMQQ